MEKKVFRPTPTLCGHFWCEGEYCNRPGTGLASYVNYKDHFELRYLRWDYIVKTPDIDENLLKKHDKTIKNLSLEFFRKNYREVQAHAMDLEDVENIARCYAMVYLGQYSFESNPENLSKYKKRFEDAHKGEPPTLDILRKKDNSNMMSFIKQRLDDCALVFRQKAEKFAGFITRHVYEKTQKGVDASDLQISMRPRQYGWRKVGWSQLAKVLPYVEKYEPGTDFVVDGVTYRLVIINSSFVYTGEYTGASQNAENEGVKAYGEIYERPQFSPLNPLQNMIELEESGARKIVKPEFEMILTDQDRADRFIEKFRDLPAIKKKKILKLLIKLLADNPRRTTELEAAQQLLRQISKKGVNGSQRHYRDLA